MVSSSLPRTVARRAAASRAASACSTVSVTPSTTRCSGAVPGAWIRTVQRSRSAGAGDLPLAAVAGEGRLEGEEPAARPRLVDPLLHLAALHLLAAHRRLEELLAPAHRHLAAVPELAHQAGLHVAGLLAGQVDAEPLRPVGPAQREHVGPGGRAGREHGLRRLRLGAQRLAPLLRAAEERRRQRGQEGEAGRHEDRLSIRNSPLLPKTRLPGRGRRRIADMGAILAVLGALSVAVAAWNGRLPALTAAALEAAGKAATFSLSLVGRAGPLDGAHEGGRGGRAGPGHRPRWPRRRSGASSPRCRPITRPWAPSS